MLFNSIVGTGKCRYEFKNEHPISGLTFWNKDYFRYTIELSVITVEEEENDSSLTDI